MTQSAGAGELGKMLNLDKATDWHAIVQRDDNLYEAFPDLVLYRAHIEVGGWADTTAQIW